MTRLHVLRVFLGPDGAGGNPLGVFLDGRAIAPERRLQVAHELGFSETVYVDDVDDASARIAIFTPGTELPFAGHPTVGTAWLLTQVGRPVATLHVRAGDVVTWQDGDRSWIRARAGWVHRLEIRQFATPAEVDALRPGTLGDPGLYAWAWEDEAVGRLRSRYFPTDLGIVEDEATGAVAVVMGDRLGRPLTIRQGVGSELVVRPNPVAGTVDVGGRCRLEETRDFETQ
ncbi:MAG: PhzF family phenazine biosynthesis protein [Chloroflexota bacterium]